MPRRLTESEFKATLTHKMHDVTKSATDVLDVWPYVESVPAADLEGHSIYEHFVEVVYRSDDGCYDHVLVMTRTENVYLTVVVDLANHSIHGHRLLDLNREYGLS
ncbi:MAG TPA: hypothetical protein VHX68_02015 [Planctomycetaceae bacterium]|nr:hypothetical protein [Planctomycetaceae bacterium]